MCDAEVTLSKIFVDIFSYEFLLIYNTDGSSVTEFNEK